MEWIKKRIYKFVKVHKSNNPFQIAQSLGIKIRYADLGETFGFYFYDSRTKFININNNLEENIQRFVCSHELGHAVLHPKANTPFLRKNTFFSVDKIEVEANCFAVNLLLSNKNLQDYETKQQALSENGIPLEMERFI